MDSLQIILNNLIEIAVSAAFAVTVKVVIPAVADFIKEKTESETIKFAMDELENTAVKVVDEIEQTVVKQYKSDGEWNAETQKAALNKAVDDMIRRLSLKTTEVVENHGVEIDKLVVSYIQARLGEIHRNSIDSIELKEATSDENIM